LAIWLLIISSFSFSVGLIPTNVRATTLYVGGAGPGNYTAIQDAIDNASSFDTIYVYGGVYYEHLVIDVPITLIGESKETAIIDGGYTSTVVDIDASDVTLREFTIRHSGPTLGDQGVHISYVENCTIENNIIHHNNAGIFLYYSSNITIANNTVQDNEDGIYLSLSDNSTVIDNVVSSNTMLGINLGASGLGVVSGNTVSNNFEGISIGYSNNSQVFGNTVSNNDYGISLVFTANTTVHNNTVGWSDFGILVKDDDNNSVLDNTVMNCTTGGIYLKMTNNNTVQGNTVLYNEYGIYLYLSDDNEVRSNEATQSAADGLALWSSNRSVFSDNTFSENVNVGTNLYSSFSNQLFHNNFLGNGFFQAIDYLGYNYWDDGYPSGGNYWDDYEGEDEMSGPNQDQPGFDGIGDTARTVWGGAMEDRYPLMHPSGGTPPYLPYKVQFLSGLEGDEELYLNWTAPSYDGSSPIANYRIYRGNSTDNIVFLFEVGNVLNYTDTNVTNGVRYYYKVSAKNSVGEGPLSDTIDIVPKAPPNQTPNVNITHPSPGEKVSGEYRIEGTATDPDGSIVRVEVRIGSESWRNATGTDTWSFDWDTTSSSNGNLTIQVRAWDDQGFSEMVSVQVTMDNPGETGWTWGWTLIPLLVGLIVIVIATLMLRRRRKIRERPEVEGPSFPQTEMPPDEASPSLPDSKEDISSPPPEEPL
jgi:parallel beta-helix repeat protein